MKTMTKQEAMAALKGRCVALIRFDDFETAKAVAHTVASAGIGALEVTFTVKDAPRLIHELKTEFGETVLVGAGTVLTAEQAKSARESGADFVTSPCILPEVGAACKQLDMLCSMGAATANEAYQSHLAGSDLSKLFPGCSINPEFIRAVQAPLPFLEFMPTDGVDYSNIGSWFENGAYAVGIGSYLTKGIDLDHLPEAASRSKLLLNAIRG